MREDAYSVVLLFHSIEERDLPSLRDLGNVRPKLFERLCRTLMQEFDVVSLKTLLECASDDSACGRLLAVTFDDGGKSYSTFAAPIAGSLGIPTACFLITDCIGDHALYWRYLYNYCINSGYGKELAGMISSEYGVSVRPEEVISFTRRNYSKEKTRNIMEGIANRFITDEEYREEEGQLFLSFEDISRLKLAPLVEFGVHTRTHPVMKALDEEEIWEEVSGSIAFYRGNIRDGAPMFSIPFGRLEKDYDERTVLAALQLDVPAVFSAYGGRNERGQPLCNLRRIPVTEEMLEKGAEAFVRSLREATVAPEYVEREKRLYETVQRWRNGANSSPKT